jgi:hypothetical protein
MSNKQRLKELIRKEREEHGLVDFKMSVKEGASTEDACKDALEMIDSVGTGTPYVEKDYASEKAMSFAKDYLKDLNQDFEDCEREFLETLGHI